MKIVLFDIDGTIYHIRTGIPQDTAVALEKLHACGVMIGLCTSRSLAYIPSEFEKLPFDVLITSNGARVQIGKSVIKESLLGPDHVKELLNLFMNHRLIPVLCGPQYVMYDEQSLTVHIDRWIDLTRKSLGNNFQSLKLYTSDIPVDKICVKVPEDQDPEFVIHKLETNPNYSVYVSRDSITGRCCEFEVMCASSTKGEAIRLTLEYLNIPRTESFAFGDGTNDIPMFHAVGNAIAMGNASDEVKTCAIHVAARFDEGGIIKALRHFELIY